MYHHADPCKFKCRLYFPAESGNNSDANYSGIDYTGYDYFRGNNIPRSHNYGNDNSGLLRWVEFDHHQKLRIQSRNCDDQDRNDRHLDKPGRSSPPDRFRLRLSGLILIQFAVNRCIVPVYVY